MKEFAIIFLCIALTFAFIAFLFINAMKQIKGKASVVISTECVGFKTSMNIDVQNNKMKNTKK